MRKLSNLMVLVLLLGNEKLLLGQTSPAIVKSYQGKVRAITAQLKSQTDQITNRKLQGRKRLDLISTLEEDSAPVPVSGNLVYRQIKELMASLEEDSVAIQNGDAGRLRSYRQNSKNFKSKLVDLSVSLGVSRVGKNNRTYIAAGIETEE